MPYGNGSGPRIYYAVDGSGAPLVLHLEFVGTLVDWYDTSLVEALKGQYTLLLIDQRGRCAIDQKDG